MALAPTELLELARQGRSQPECRGKGAGETSIFAELGWIATNFAVVVRKLGEVKAILRSLALGQGVTIDYDEIARKVADEQDRRDRERLDVTKDGAK